MGWAKESEVVYSQSEHVKLYKERYETYKKLYENVQVDFFLNELDSK